MRYMLSLGIQNKSTKFMAYFDGICQKSYHANRLFLTQTVKIRPGAKLWSQGMLDWVGSKHKTKLTQGSFPGRFLCLGRASTQC